MDCVDSRRLTGANLQWDSPGAVIEVLFDGADPATVIGRWERSAREVLAAVGWAEQTTCVRPYPGGASLAISAPIDALYAACEVNETAWAMAQDALTGGSGMLAAGRTAELVSLIEQERDGDLRALAEAAAAHDVTFLSDDEIVTVGLGAGSSSWPVGTLPRPDQVDWSAVHDVPLALVTGTNGKTTTVRMLACIASHAGLRVANTSTDGVQLDGETVLPGDYTGPEGARALLRDQRVQIACLETARGGLLRRGLPVPRADGACVTNVGHDHFGEYGIESLEAVAAVKMLVARAVAPRRLILNADDPVLVSAAQAAGIEPTWFSLVPERPAAAREHAPVWTVREGFLGLLSGSAFERVVAIDRIPSALDGAARHNVANALCAAALARLLDLPDAAIAAGLESFGSAADHNPGRGNLVEFGELRAWVDFAHNPEGLRAILDLASGLEPARVLLILGQAGDRDDASIDALAEIGAAAAPARILLKEMRKYLRGRQEGEVVGMLRDRLRAVAYPDERVAVCDSELDAVREALRWGRSGDLLLLLVHSQRDETLRLLDHLQGAGWMPGDPLPKTEEDRT